MTESAPDNKSARKSGRQPAFIGCCLFLPLLLVVMTALVYVNNNRPINFKVPTPRMPDPNAYDDFVKAGKLAKAMKHKSPISMPQPSFTFADFEAAARDAEPALAVVRQGLHREYRNPPVRSYRTDPSFPVFATFRELARIESGVAIYHEMNGDPAKATEARLDGLEMAVVMPRGGQLIAGLVGVACEAIEFSQFEPPLPLLSEAELAHVASRLDRIAAQRVPYADILQEEGYGETANDVEMLNDPKGYRNFDTIRELLAEDIYTPQGAIQKKPLSLQENWKAVSFLLADKAAMIRENQAYNDAMVAEARGPYKAASSVPVPHNFLAELRGGLLSESRARFASMEAVMSIMRTEVALFRYKKAHQRFPATLSVLIPIYISPEAMIDPFAGARLHYRPVENGRNFVLYSVGPDQKDDAGKPSKHVGDKPGDIVAGKMWRHRTFKK